MKNPASTLVGLYWLAMMGLIMIFVGWDAAGDNASAAMLGLNFALMYGIAMVLGVAEVAVCSLVVRLVGDVPMVVQIGSGPQLFLRLRNQGSQSVALHAMPFGSRVVLTSTRRAGQRTRLAIAMLASASMYALIAIPLIRSGTWAEFKVSLASNLAPVEILAMISTFYAVVLFLSILGVPLTDATKLETSRSLGHSLVTQRHMQSGAFKLAEESARRGLDDVPNFALLELMLLQCLSMRDDESTIEIASRMLEREDLSPAVRAGVQNVWAWQVYVRQLDEHRDAADKLTQTALETSPDSWPILDTRGHVLIWLGRGSEAEPLLVRAHDNSTEMSTKVSSAVALAILHAQRGNLDEAHRWLAKVRDRGIHQHLIARAAAIVEPLRRIPGSSEIA